MVLAGKAGIVVAVVGTWAAGFRKPWRQSAGVAKIVAAAYRQGSRSFAVA